MKNDKQEQSLIRQIFRSEITWVLTLVASIWAFVTTVVMPIQALQLGQTKIQEQLSMESNRYVSTEERVNTLEKNQAVVMSRLQLKLKQE